MEQATYGSPTSAEALAAADAEFEAEMLHEYRDEVEAAEAGLDHRSANGILRRIAQEKRHIALIEEQRRDEIERINARAEELKQAHEGRVQWLEDRYGDMLKDFAAKELEGQRTRTITLLNGKLHFRKNPSSLKIEDMDAALEWAKANLPDAVKVVESVGVTPLKAYVEGTGEALPFIEYSPSFDKFYMDAEV
ncbi:MAG: host-nuclease inhibitor Gam family protein [Armatimonadetes bacterium]|nr:host-nuclease inhibitor Gam family protein [Armatimonadota bacterium]